MVWWKTDSEVPEALKNMKPEELVSAVQKAGEVDQLKADLAANSAKLSEFDAVKTRLASLEASAPKPVQQQQTGPTSFLENEDVAFNERLAPFAVATLQNQARSAKFMAKTSLSGQRLAMWNKYEAEIDEVMKGVDLSFQGQPETWMKAMNSVLGNHIDDITKMASDKTEFFAESSVTGHGPQAQVDPEKIDAEDEKIMKRFGLTPEQYKASRKEMVVRSV